MIPPIEDIVRGYVNQSRSPLARNFRQKSRSLMIKKVCHIQVVFGLVYISKGGAVNDEVYLLALGDEFHGLLVGHVQINDLLSGRSTYVTEDEMLVTIKASPTKFPAELTVSPCYQYIHNLFPHKNT